MEVKKSVLEILLQSANYMPFVYPQLTMDKSNIFTIRYPFAEIPDNSLLFMVPIRNSQELGEDVQFNKLKLLMPRIVYNTGDGTTSVDYDTQVPKVFNIFLEGLDGKLTPASLNALIANRMAIFRFIKNDNNSVILINNPYYNNMQLNTIVVNQDATFRSVPVLQPDPNDSTNQTKLALESDMIALENRIAALENKFLYGAEEPDTALADSPDGTIYIKVEEDK